MAWAWHGMASVNQTRPHCVNKMGKTHSKPLEARHGRGTAWARHAMCESALSRFNFIGVVPANPVLSTQNTKVWHSLCYILATEACSSWTSIESYHSNNGEVWAGYCHVALWRPDRSKNRMYGGFLFRIRWRSVTGLYCRETSPNNYVPVVDSVNIWQF